MRYYFDNKNIYRSINIIQSERRDIVLRNKNKKVKMLICIILSDGFQAIQNSTPPPRVIMQIKVRHYKSHNFFWWQLGNKRKSKSSSHKGRLIKQNNNSLKETR